MADTEISGNHKRKWEGGSGDQYYNFFSKISKVDSNKTTLPLPLFDIDFHLEKPLPLDWKQCLDIQSGKIHFYNTQTQKESCKDPRQSHLGLDLELNLSCDSPRQNHVTDQSLSMNSNASSPKKKADDEDAALARCTSWMSFEEDHKEMVAAVCMRCNMLVMLCKSSPACPNCKFMHPADQRPTSPFKPPRFSSLMPCRE